MDAGLSADAVCSASLGVADIDAGSFDPDGAADIDSLCITEVDSSPVGCLDSVDFTDDLGAHSAELTISGWWAT